MSDERDMRHLADGLALWEEMKPQTPEDWLAVAVRSIEREKYDPRVGSPIFQALYKAVAGLIECARQAGADISDGAPTWPPVDEWAVREVTELRRDHDEDLGGGRA